MTHSESIKAIAKALGLFHVKIEKIKKENTNPFFHSKYASLSTILNAIDIPLTETGLVFSQLPDGVNGLTTILIHAESGEYFESTYTMPVAKQNDPQAVGSAITYARRYALGAILGLNIDDDDDGNKASVQPQYVPNTSTTPPASTPASSQPQKAWLNKNTVDWTDAVKALRNGSTIADIQKQFAVSKANQAELLTQSNIPA